MNYFNVVADVLSYKLRVSKIKHGRYIKLITIIFYIFVYIIFIFFERNLTQRNLTQNNILD